MNDSLSSANLVVGDHYVRRLEYDGRTSFCYERVLRVEPDGSRVVESFSRDPGAASHPPLPAGSHRIHGRLSRRAFELARLRTWPDSEEAVQELVQYSAGGLLRLSVQERLQLVFVP
jgi:hypothetical protein